MDLPDTTLVFDTETNGLPLFKSPPTHPGQPFIKQLGAILYDSTWRPVMEMNVLIKPAGWVVPPHVAAITGITTEMCEKYGISLDDAMRMFLTMVKLAKLSVAHNFKFDQLLTEIAAHRCALNPIWPTRSTFCTMEAMTSICKLPGPYGYKWPKLIEAYKYAFNEEFSGAHDAMIDVRACGRVFNWGYRNNHFHA